jgi:hypothetical protein
LAEIAPSIQHLAGSLKLIYFFTSTDSEMATLQQEQGAATAVEIGFPHDKILHEQT